jgi:peptidoglycan/LPS O-acetylase OafA/YrhL
MLFRSLSRNLHLGQTGLNVTVLSVGTALVLIWLQKRFENGRQHVNYLTGIFRFFGRNSYEVYLTHMFIVFIMVAVYQSFNLSGAWTWALYLSTIILSGLLGELVARYFSVPMNARIRKFSGFTRQ